LRRAWLEGNNLLFAGQLLVYLRDQQAHPSAGKSLDVYFDWLSSRVDPATGLWGTNVGSPLHAAMYGSYHQLLVFYHENRPIPFPRKLVDTVLSLQHQDGGFSEAPGGGACEDADGVDILTNLYKAIDYRRSDIRRALRKCRGLILSLQANDGGFVYRSDTPFIHMRIPDTASGQGQSNMFPTWFRVHTLALSSQILTHVSPVGEPPMGFNSTLSMGWHRAWDIDAHPLGFLPDLRDRLRGPWVSRDILRRSRAAARRTFARFARLLSSSGESRPPAGS
jgi:hypothetical protein